MRRQVAIHVPDDQTLARIDTAAERAGESRSAFILRAALARANNEIRELSPAKRKQLALEIGEAAIKALGI